MLKAFSCSIVCCLFLSLFGCVAKPTTHSFPETAVRPDEEPFWAEFVREAYPGWSKHYWTDRKLWGNQGYIIGKPPELPSEKIASLHLRGVDKEIKKLDLSQIFIQESGAPSTDNLESFETLPLKPKATKHVVKKGESLWVIASYEETYGNPLMWPLIYQSNRDKIKDPDWIYPGQVFTIPPEP